MRELIKYIEDTFNVETKVFLEILQSNPNARQNINGILGEILFKKHAESIGYKVLRIKEKPGGGYNAKKNDARGDFYIKKRDNPNDEWLVVECKGVKSNAEKRSTLTNSQKCFRFLTKHSINRKKHCESIYKSGLRAYNKEKENWENKNKGQFPDFKWDKINPGPGIPDISGLWENEDDIESWLAEFKPVEFSEDAYWNLTAPIRFLQTHMPSIRTDPNTRIKSTGPLVGEFNILSVDLFLKTGKHEFVFANSRDLNHQAKSPNHLQQNYAIDILTSKDNYKRHKLLKPWYSNLNECLRETNPKPRKLDKTQLDLR